MTVTPYIGSSPARAAACRAPLTVVPPADGPVEVVESQRDAAIVLVRGHAERAPARPFAGRLAPTRNQVLEQIYHRDLVDASRATGMLSDKLLMYRVLHACLGEQVHEFHPRAVGVKELLDWHGLVSGSGALRASRAAVDEVLAHEFPDGCIVKPAVDMGSGGSRLVFDRDRLLDGLVEEHADLYTRHEFDRPFEGDGGVASGERLFIMERIPRALEASPNVAGRGADAAGIEVRLHTLHGRVIADASLARWNAPGVESTGATRRAVRFATRLLDALPPGLTGSQAWSLDVFVTGEGARLVEINTNRGEPTNWSGILKRPDVLGAYARHLERHHDWRFDGVEGSILRHGLGNLRQHVRGEIEFVLRDLAILPVTRAIAVPKLRRLAHAYEARFASLPRRIAVSAYMREQRALVDGFREPALRTREVGDAAWQEVMAWLRAMS